VRDAELAATQYVVTRSFHMRPIRLNICSTRMS
jgi:hypothetical protein